MIDLFAESYQEYLTDDGREAIRIQCSDGQAFSILKPVEFDFALPENQQDYLDHQCQRYSGGRNLPDHGGGWIGGGGRRGCDPAYNFRTQRLECIPRGHRPGHGLPDDFGRNGGKGRGGNGFE